MNALLGYYAWSFVVMKNSTVLFKMTHSLNNVKLNGKYVVTVLLVCLTS